MKKKIEQNNKIEVVCWRFAEKSRKTRTKSAEQIPSTVKCVAGFVISENKKSLEISSTKATHGFIDTVKILKSSIVSRVKYLFLII